MRRSPIFPLVALLLASIAALAVFSALRAKDARIAQATPRTTEILVATHDLPFGTKLTLESVRLARWPLDLLPGGTIANSSAVIGSTVRQAIAANEPVLEGQIVSGDHKSGLLPMLIPPNMRAMSVAVDEVADISGFVLPHTRVDILATYSDRAAGNISSLGKARIVLENVEVLAVAQTTEKDQPQIEKVVTVLVTPQQAERLALVSHEASMRLALRSYDDDQFVESSGVTVADVFGQAPTTAVAAPGTKVARTGHHPGILRSARVVKVEVLRDGETRQALSFDGPRGHLTETANDAPDAQPAVAAEDAAHSNSQQVAGPAATTTNSNQAPSYAEIAAHQ